MELANCMCGGKLTFEFGDFYLELAKDDVELIQGVSQYICVECGNQFVSNVHVDMCRGIVERARSKVSK